MPELRLSGGTIRARHGKGQRGRSQQPAGGPFAAGAVGFRALHDCIDCRQPGREMTSRIA
jgi:hypothetical protein